VLDRITATDPCAATLVWQTMPGRRLAAPGAGAAVVVTATVDVDRREDTGPFSPWYTHLDVAPRTSFRATGDDVVFATVVALTGGRPSGVDLHHDAAATTLEIRARRSLRVAETWIGPGIRVDGA
jgi:hypothetical protein